MHLDIPDQFEIGPLLLAIQQEAERQHHRLSIGFEKAQGRGVLRLTPQWLCENDRQLPLNPKVIPITQARAARGGSTHPRLPSSAA